MWRSVVLLTPDPLYICALEMYAHKLRKCIRYCRIGGAVESPEVGLGVWITYNARPEPA
jgi:hypothetical protein